MKTAIIIRGTSGSGKSTLAEYLKSITPAMSVAELSADQFMVDKHGDYKFDRNKLSECHSKCYEEFREFIDREFNLVIVANTFTRFWEFKNYHDYAISRNYKVFVVVVENHHGSGNIHNVPDEIVRMQRDRFEFK